MKRNLKAWQWVAIGLATLLILTLSIAPFPNNVLRAGSSYSRAPDGYGAWYHQMQTRVCIGRWHRPLADLTGSGTLIQVFPDWHAPPLSDSLAQWVKQGNTLIRLGVQAPVTAAPFLTDLPPINSPGSPVRIATRRRQSSDALTQIRDLLKPTSQEQTVFLGDRYGPVVWQSIEGKGRVIQSSTPYLAANAYQDQPGNFAFLAQLAQLAQAPSGVIWMDEHQSGYRPSQQAEREEQQQASQLNSTCRQQLALGKKVTVANRPKAVSDPFAYLLQTPIGLVVLQGLVLLILLVVSQNRRFGLPQPWVDVTQDNTTAYIQALATVLQKANCHGFVVTTILKAEQRYIQQRLGLGVVLIDPMLVLETWQNLGFDRQPLEKTLIYPPADRCREQELVTWLAAWKQIRAALATTNNPLN